MPGPARLNGGFRYFIFFYPLLDYLNDFALQTGDKEWFEELTAELNRKRQAKN